MTTFITILATVISLKRVTGVLPKMRHHSQISLSREWRERKRKQQEQHQQQQQRIENITTWPSKSAILLVNLMTSIEFKSFENGPFSS